ncbi:hypothetical protein [Nocardiopsis sp. FR6]|uniref:hypothetical protein n=1 Tax=Nocardiopsis sp. FR6 TaxID=2605986 RepID=UPI001357588B|nr:hypothetical protein [Nocardiopsis sp. FR6]
MTQAPARPDTAPGDWPDTRQPDNTKIDAQIRELGYDPVNKKGMDGMHFLFAADYTTTDGAQFLNDALKDKSYKVIVRSQVLTFAPGPFQAVSDLYTNCTEDTAPMELQWSQTVSSTMSFEVTAGVEATFFEVVKASMSMSFGMSWTTSETFSSTYGMQVRSKHLGWMERSANRQTITGEIWVIKEPDFFTIAWYGNGQITGQATDGRPKGTLVPKTRPMTQGEISKFCTTRQDDGAGPVLPSFALPYLSAVSLDAQEE